MLFITSFKSSSNISNKNKDTLTIAKYYILSNDICLRGGVCLFLPASLVERLMLPWYYAQKKRDIKLSVDIG